MHSIGSRQELFEMSGDERAKTVELHRPYIDEITLKEEVIRLRQVQNAVDTALRRREQPQEVQRKKHEMEL